MSLSPVLGVRIAGLLAGLGLVGLFALQAWRVPATARPATAAVDVRALSSGEVGVADAGQGRFRLSNRTAGALRLRAQVQGGVPEADSSVSVTLAVAGRVVYRGPLGGLREGVSTPVPLPRGGTASGSVRAVGPTGVEGRWSLTFSGAGAAR
ncbi:MAG: hypothetical protein M3389_04925 [Actinomycetota bacterium]|nr:hypothetical protein [Actinomycetota bacterium]